MSVEQYKTIYLENDDDGGDGQQWCAIKIWSDENCTQYVRVNEIRSIIENEISRSNDEAARTLNSILSQLEDF